MEKSLVDWEMFVNTVIEGNRELHWRLADEPKAVVNDANRIARWADDFENAGEKINLVGGLF